MYETAIAKAPAISSAQKLAALDAALHSQTLARADQLKSFLKYICEMELAGRGHELTEYRIGVEALGRPANYSPGDDATVRNRAFGLRKKLQEFYELEQPAAAIRIELTKGSYCPHYVENPTKPQPGKPQEEAFALAALAAPELALLPTPETLPVEPAPQAAAPARWWPGFLAGALAMAALALLFYGLSAARQAASNAAPLLAEAWGPLLAPGNEVMMVVANPPNLSVHPGSVPGATSTGFNDPNGRPMPAELLDWFKTRYPATGAANQHLTITTNATYWGDTLGALTAYRTLAAAHAAPRLLPEKVLSIPTLRQRNVVLLGAPEYSPAIAHFLEKCPLTVNFLTAIVANQQPPTPLYRLKRDPSDRIVEVYGLITVLPSDSAIGQQHRTVIFSGINSAGTQAAAEFFTSPENLQVLKQQFTKDGHATFPAAYQVVVRAETDDSLLLSFRYETWRRLPAAETLHR